MKNTSFDILKAFVIAVLMVFLSIILQMLFVYLFPYTGLGRIISIPMSIGLSIVVSIIYFFSIYTIESEKKYPILISIPVLILVIFLNAQLFPQDNGAPITVKLRSYISAYQDYESIKYDDIYLTNDRDNYVLSRDIEARYIAALQKFESEIPRDGSFSLYNFREDSSASPSDKNILIEGTDIQTLLKTGAEKEFFKLLEATR